MSRLPIPRFIQEIKTKLGFDRTMTAPGEDIVDAVNKQAKQIGDLTQLRTSTIDSLVNAINTTISTYTIGGAVDFNNITENGFYRIASSNASNNPNSDSTTFYGILLNVKINGYNIQLALTVTSQGNPVLFIRSTTTNTWTGMNWINLTAVTLGTIQTSLVTLQGETFLKKKNGNVGLELTFKPLEDIPAWTVFATIPEGFRPPKAIFSMDIYARDTNPLYQINPDGTIQAGFNMTASTQYRSVPIMWML